MIYNDLEILCNTYLTVLDFIKTCEPTHVRNSYLIYKGSSFPHQIIVSNRYRLIEVSLYPILEAGGGIRINCIFFNGDRYSSFTYTLKQNNLKVIIATDRNGSYLNSQEFEISEEVLRRFRIRV